MIIFNGSNLDQGLVPTEISIDGESYFKLKAREYINISITPGTHELSIRHRDPFFRKYYQNSYTMDVSEKDTALKVYNCTISTKFKLLNELPKKFYNKFIDIESPAEDHTRKKRMLNFQRVLVPFFIICCFGLAAFITWDLLYRYDSPPCYCNSAYDLPCKINGVCIRYDYDPDLFFSQGWLWNCEGEQFDMKHASRVSLDIEEFISRYNSGFIKEHLTDIFLVGDLECYHAPRAGTYFGSAVFIQVTNYSDDQEVQGILHHELSSFLMKKYDFPKKEWRRINEGHFSYTGKALEMMKDVNSPELLPGSNEAGFLSEYSKTTMENDFNTYADYLFTRRAELCELQKKHKRIDKKARLAVEFYESINSGVEFFECE